MNLIRIYLLFISKFYLNKCKKIIHNNEKLLTFSHENNLTIFNYKKLFNFEGNNNNYVNNKIIKFNYEIKMSDMLENKNIREINKEELNSETFVYNSLSDDIQGGEEEEDAVKEQIQGN